MGDLGAKAERPASSSGRSQGRIAVVLVTYNGRRYIADQLKSIMGQTNSPDLLVISDDGSTDDTLELCRRYTADWLVPVTILEPPARPRGRRLDRISANVMRGLAAASSSDLVALSDQDDAWLPRRLELSFNALATKPALFSFGNAIIMDEGGQDTPVTLFDHYRVPQRWNELTPLEQFRFALRRPFATGTTMLLTRELIQAASPIPNGWLHDRWLSLVGCASGGGRAVYEPLLRYRQHPGQVVGVRPRRRSIRAIEILRGSGSAPATVRKFVSLQTRLRNLGVPHEILDELMRPRWLLDRE